LPPAQADSARNALAASICSVFAIICLHSPAGTAALPVNRDETAQPNRRVRVDVGTQFPKEPAMTVLRLSLSAAALLAGISVACAQQAPAAANTAAQNNEQAKPAQNGAEEPGSHPAASADPNAFIDGKLNVPGAPADSQTVPSKVSERNARLDGIPIMALPLGLSDEQKTQILTSTKTMPVSQISAKPADMLPATTQVSELPADVTNAMPMMKDISIIRTSNKILLVRAPSMVVTGEIAVQ
jgi:hypothetical protein